MKKIILAIAVICLGAIMLGSCSKAEQSGVYKYKMVGGSDYLPTSFFTVMEDYLDKKFNYKTEIEANAEFQMLVDKLDKIEIERYLQQDESVTVRLDLYDKSGSNVTKQIAYKTWSYKGEPNN